MTDAQTPEAHTGFPPWPWAWLGVSVLVVALDAFTKQRVSEALELYRPVEVLSWLNITLAHNYGAAFSFLSDAGGWQRWFFVTLASAVSAYIVFWLWKIKLDGQVILSAGLSLVLGGALGNVIDRIVHGSVVDFIQVLIAGWPFPSFNVTDTAISVGAVLPIIDALFFSGKENQGSKPKL